MTYYLIVAFQAFCIYHLIKNKNNFYWIFLIIFLPVVGCVIYLATQVYSKRDGEKIQENFTTIINPTKKIKDLENRLEFSETYQNRVNLADAHFALKDYPNAIVHYKIALEDNTQNDYHVQKHLILSYYHQGDYETVIADSERLLHTLEFDKAQLKYVYGSSLEKLGRTDEALVQLRTIDKPYSNYPERLALIQFLMKQEQKSEAKDILNEVYAEIQNMTKMNRKIYRSTILEIEKLHTVL